MIFKKQTNVSSAKYFLNLSHDKIVDMLNDEDVQIEDGNVSKNQIFNLSLIESNGTRQHLYNLKPSQKLSIRFKNIIKLDADCGWLKIKQVKIENFKIGNGVVVGGNKTIIRCIYNPRSSGGVIVGGSSVGNGVVVGGFALISDNDLFYEINYSQTGLCCHEPIVQIYDNDQRIAAGANYFTLKPIVENTFVESTLVPPEFQKFNRLPRAVGKGLFHNYLAPGLPFNIGYGANEIPKLKVPYPAIAIPENESITSNDWRVFIKMTLTGVDYETPLIYKLFPNTGEKEIGITSDIFIPRWWGSPSPRISWPALPSGTLSFLARAEEEDEYAEDGTRSDGIGGVGGDANRVCSLDSVFHLNHPVTNPRMTEYDCLEVMDGDRFVSDQELESSPLGENYQQCDYCKDACCYPLYDCSTCLQNNPNSEIFPTILSLDPLTNGRLEFFNFVFSFKNVSSASPIDLNKAAWNWRNDYPNKLAGKRVVWWLIDISRRLDGGVTNDNLFDLNYWSWIKYKKYVCLLCEDGELVDITSEAIEGLPVYIEEDSEGIGWPYLNLIDENFIYTQFPSGGISCGGHGSLVYNEKMKGGVSVGLTSPDHGVRVGGIAVVDAPLGFLFGKFNDYLNKTLEKNQSHTIEINKQSHIKDEQIIASPSFINQSILQSLGTIKSTEIGSTANYSFAYFEKQKTDYPETRDYPENKTTESIRLFSLGSSQLDLYNLMKNLDNWISQHPHEDDGRIDYLRFDFSFYREDFVNICQNNFGFNPSEIPAIDEFRRYDQPPTALDCTDQEPIGYLCEDKLQRNFEIWDIPTGSRQKVDRRSWCEHTKKGTFYETTICDELTCPAEELGMASADKLQNTTIRPERRKNPLP